MMFKNKLKKKFSARTSSIKFLFLPIVHRGRLHWLSNVKLEKAFNGYKMMIINIQKA
ncbi:hypothetical protein [Tenacibaculum sp. 190524A05c]|uniref:Transposase DDE domain-containing protein n=1 Tax=Tenacibaculum platacis TaxID=3137852 RepID=A0ABM9P677_9FLAO